MNPIYQGIAIWLTLAIIVMLMVLFENFTNDDVNDKGEIK
jgi:hypothetical protein